MEVVMVLRKDEVVVMVRLPVTVEVVGLKVTVMAQEAPGATAAHLKSTGRSSWRLGEANPKPLTWLLKARVLVMVMVCCVAVGSGMLLKTRAVGLRLKPGSGEP